MWRVSFGVIVVGLLIYGLVVVDKLILLIVLGLVVFDDG